MRCGARIVKAQETVKFRAKSRKRGGGGKEEEPDLSAIVRGGGGLGGGERTGMRYVYQKVLISSQNFKKGGGVGG